MSPRASSSSGPSSSQRNASAPYTRRPAGQPKSTRQQFSACGACRMRRVRCDLKDLPYTATGPHPSCSNCKERGLKCVDEFADVKAVKLLRRGRRLQQVEAIYGKTQNGSSSSATPPETRLPSIIPQLTPDFFLSPFWKWFCVQRPILDPIEFPSRFISHTKGITTLGHEGGLLAMMLVIWAASFGLNERGLPDSDDMTEYQGEEDDESPPPGTITEARGKEVSRKERRNFKEKTDAMLREVLELIDFHGVLRRPTWDGVRVLLLLLPLMEDSHQLERIAMHEATLSQAQALCMTSGPASMIQPFPENTDSDIIRAQIFWYAHVYEGVAGAMRGHRLVLNNDDFETFQSNLAHVHNARNNSGFPSPPPSSSGLRPMSSHGLAQKNSQSFSDLSQLFGLPLHMSALGRKVHIMLTGNKAMKRAEEHGLIDARGMEEIWEDLDGCWQDFEQMRRLRIEAFDVEQYVSAWQIFIFECHNIIRETLRQYTTLASSSGLGGHSRPSSHSSSSPYLPPQHLHAIATRKCLSLLPATLSMIRYHLSLEKTIPGGGLFTWDAGLVRDGCYYAGYLSASVEGDTIEFPTDERDDEATRARAHMSCEDAVTLCIAAISEMRWAFSKSDEREESLRSLWDEKQAGRNSLRYRGGQDPSSTYARSLSNSMPASHATTFNALTDFDRRPSLPPINLGSPRRVESAPNTGYSTTGHGANGWPSYTPPGTGTSVATSATGMSRGSPAFHSMPPAPSGLKHDLSETFYHVSHDLDQFSFQPPPLGGALTEATLAAAGYHTEPPGSSHSLHGMATPGTYLTNGVFVSPSCATVHSHCVDAQGCPAFGDDLDVGFYH